MLSIEENKKYKENKKATSDIAKDKIRLDKIKQKKKTVATKPTKASSLKKSIKNQKTRSRSKLVKDLDTIFSRFIRLRDSDNKGICSCITCGEKYAWKQIQNGHFITRGNYKYRRDESNCYSQCMPCNIYKSGNYISYTLRMIKMLGEDKVKEMQEDKELVKISTPELREKIQYYKEKVLQLESKLL